jgi:phosphatidylglycerol:prolipoprotein diacylglycerol transferase
VAHAPTLATYLHRIDPFIIELWSGGGLRWYGFSYIFGFVGAYALLWWMAKRKLTPLTTQQVADFTFLTAICTVIGGRLGYCLFYDQALLVEFTSKMPFWGVLAIHRGGMASHGGVIGIIVSAIIFSRKHKLFTMHLLDLCSMVCGIGIAAGRTANFINGELFGKIAKGEAWWAVRFPQAMFDWPKEQPDKLAGLAPVIDAIGPGQFGNGITGESFNLAIATTDPQQISWMQSALHRIVEVMQRDDALGDRVAAMVEPMLMPRHPWPVYAALLEGVLLFVTLGIVWRIARKPGVISAWFLLVYGCVRVFNELTRVPDPQSMNQEYWLLGITRVQLLSSVMVISGIVMLIWAARRDVPKFGGFLKPAATANASG